MPKPLRGEIWLADLDPIRGHEQAGRRPVLVVSHDVFNQGPAELVVALPVTSTQRRVLYHVPVRPPEGGVRRPCFIQCEAIRSLATERFLRCWGKVARHTLAAVEDHLRILLNL